MSLLQAVENASRRVSDERQRYFDSTILSAGARAIPLQLGSSPFGSAAAATGSIIDQVDAGTYSGQEMYGYDNEFARSNVKGISPPQLPPPLPCENCLMLRSAVKHLRSNVAAVEQAYQAQVEQLQETVSFVEGERLQAREQLRECFEELQRVQTMVLQRDAKLQEERGRCQTLELLLESSSRKAAMTSVIAPPAVAMVKDLLHVIALEGSERNALFSLALLQGDLLHVTYCWGLDVIRANEKAAAIATHLPIDRGTPVRHPSVVTSEQHMSPVARSLADAMSGTTPLPVPAQTHSSSQDTAAIRMLTAEIDALTVTRDALIDQLTTAKHEALRAQRALTALQEQQASRTGDVVATTLPAIDVDLVLKMERDLVEVIHGESRARSRHINFQTREYFNLVADHLGRITAELMSENVKLRRSHATDISRLEDAVRSAFRDRDALDTELSSAKQQIKDLDAEVEVLRTLPPPPPVAFEDFLPEPPANMRHPPVDAAIQVVLDEDKDRELAMLRRMLFEAKEEVITRASELQASRSQVTELEKLLLLNSQSGKPPSAGKVQVTSSPARALSPTASLDEGDLLPQAPLHHTASEAQLLGMGVSVSSTPPPLPQPTKPTLPSVPADKLPATTEQLASVHSSITAAVDCAQQATTIATAQHIADLRHHIDAVVGALETTRKSDSEKVIDALAAIRYALRNMLTNTSHHQKLLTLEAQDVKQLAADVRTQVEAVKTLAETMKTDREVSVSTAHDATLRDHALLSLSSPGSSKPAPKPSLSVDGSAAPDPMLSHTQPPPMPAFSRPAEPSAASQPVAPAASAASIPTQSTVVRLGELPPPPPPPPPVPAVSAPSVPSAAAPKLAAGPSKPKSNFDDSDDEKLPPPPPPPPVVPAVQAAAAAPPKAEPAKVVEASMLSKEQAAALRPKPKVSVKK